MEVPRQAATSGGQTKTRSRVLTLCPQERDRRPWWCRAQVFYRHGRLRMYRQCQAVRVTGQDGLVIVINGLVRISYRDPFGNHQQFFLGTGARAARGRAA